MKLFFVVFLTFCLDATAAFSNSKRVQPTINVTSTEWSPFSQVEFEFYPAKFKEKDKCVTLAKGAFCCKVKLNKSKIQESSVIAIYLSCDSTSSKHMVVFNHTCYDPPKSSSEYILNSEPSMGLLGSDDWLGNDGILLSCYK